MAANLISSVRRKHRLFTVAGNMKEELEKVKLSTIYWFENGLAENCADDFYSIGDLEDNTCDYLELIPIPEKIAERDLFCYWDDNGGKVILRTVCPTDKGAGGDFQRVTKRPLSGRSKQSKICLINDSFLRRKLKAG